MGIMKLRQKLFLILFGLLTCFLLLEIGLRIAGKVYYLYRTKVNVTQFVSKDAIRILCLGDSFTFGEGAAKAYSYPDHLQRILDANLPKKFEVYNVSVPGSNSSYLFKNLERNIQIYAPHIIIVMIGANNDNNFTESNYFLFMAKSPKIYLYRLDAFLSHMRSYKLLKTAMVNLYSKVKPREKLTAKFFIDDSKERQDRTKAVAEKLKEEAKRHLGLGELYVDQSKFKLAEGEFKKAAELNPYDDRGYYMLGFIYLHRFPDRHKSAIQAFKKALAINPFNVSAHENLFNTYYRMGETDLALEELKIIIQLNPDEEWAHQLLAYGIPENKDMEVFEKTLAYDLENIISLAAAKKIKLVLQNYPGSWANNTLKEVAQRHKIIFVDNEYSFEKLKLLNRYKKRDYFAEDGHCNCAGYQIIAENIYTVLNSQIQEIIQ